MVWTGNRFWTKNEHILVWKVSSSLRQSVSIVCPKGKVNEKGKVHMTIKKSMMVAGVAGVAVSLLLPNLAGFAQAQTVPVNPEPVNANALAPVADADALTDKEVELIIKYVNSIEESQKKLGIKILKKFYKDLTDAQKKLIDKNVKDDKDKKEIMGEKPPEKKPNEEKKPDLLNDLQNQDSINN